MTDEGYRAKAVEARKDTIRARISEGKGCMNGTTRGSSRGLASNSRRLDLSASLAVLSDNDTDDSLISEMIDDRAFAMALAGRNQLD